MYRSRSNRARKMIIGAAAVTLLGGAFAVSTGMSQAGESCAGLDTALGNNLNFIAGQKANPDALSDARIANRQAVVDLIQQRRATAGCTGDGGAGAADDEGGNGNAGGNGNGNGNAGGNGNGNAGGNGNGRGNGGGNDGANDNGNNGNANGVQGNGNGRGNNGNGNGNGGARDADDDAADDAAAQPPAAAAPANPPAAGGEVVCAGSTVTLSGEGGAPAASSGTFPVGTTLRVTNLDNHKVTTVKVASGSGSCVLLNNAAFEQVREPGKFLIRRAVIERVG